MNSKLTREQWYELQDQLDHTPAIPEAQGVLGEHFKLINLLNRFGFYPASKMEALELARELLEQGWEEI